MLREQENLSTMADPVTSSSEKSSQSHTGAILGWGALAVGTIAFIYFISLQLGVGWEGREQEALKHGARVQGLRACSTTSPTRRSPSATRRARRAGSSASSPGRRSTTRGRVYKVELTWKEGSSNHRATWKVNLEDKSVLPATSRRSGS